MTSTHDTAKYPANFRLRLVDDQHEMLEAFFSFGKIASITDEPHINIPEGADGLFVIPYWRDIDDVGYYHATNTVLRLISHHHSYLNLSFNDDDIRGITRRQRTEDALFKLQCKQVGMSRPIIVPAQFGMRFAGTSPRNVISSLSSTDDSEFSLGVFEVATMILTHPERFIADGDCGAILNVDCTADMKIVANACCIPFFTLTKSGLRLGMKWSGDEDKFSGTATAFNPYKEHY